MDISTNYMGLRLANPVIVASSSLTANIEAVKKACNAKAGALVLKSLFEEDIAKVKANSNIDNSLHPEAYEYIEQMHMMLEPDAYIGFVEECVQSVDIPIIASLNCYSTHWWVEYLERIANVGADGIELNLSPIALSHKTTSEDIEKQIVDMVSLARKTVSIPLAVKLGPGFTSLPHLASQLKAAGANALTLFNRYYRMDFDLNAIEFKSGNSLSSAEEFGTVLRWMGILSDSSGLDLSASTGVYDADSLIKVILAGGKAAQLCSVLYRNGLGVIDEILEGLKKWMEEHGYNNIEDFQSLLSLQDDHLKSYYHRLQYVKSIKGEK